MFAETEKTKKLAEIKEIVEPILVEAGYELVEIQLTGWRNRGILRVFIDSEEGVSVDDCAKMSEEISVNLDVSDPINGSYVLEVSSPGLDRPLRKERDFRRALGKKLHVAFITPQDGKSEVQGRLISCEEEVVTLRNGRGTCEIPMNNIQLAKLRF